MTSPLDVARLTSLVGPGRAAPAQVEYDSVKGWFATLTCETETGARSRSAGETRWLKAVRPF